MLPSFLLSHIQHCQRTVQNSIHRQLDDRHIYISNKFKFMYNIARFKDKIVPEENEQEYQKLLLSLVQIAIVFLTRSLVSYGC